MLTVRGQLVGRADDKRAKEPIAERDLERRQIRRQESRLAPRPRPSLRMPCPGTKWVVVPKCRRDDAKFRQMEL